MDRGFKPLFRSKYWRVLIRLIISTRLAETFLANMNETSDGPTYNSKMWKFSYLIFKCFTWINFENNIYKSLLQHSTRLIFFVIRYNNKERLHYNLSLMSVIFFGYSTVTVLVLLGLFHWFRYELWIFRYFSQKKNVCKVELSDFDLFWEERSPRQK
jgi:hypothetical protein